MPVAVNQPQRREEKDPLDTIVKGLSIASSIYGLKDAGVKADQLRAQTELQSTLAKKQIAQLENQEKGILTAPEVWKAISEGKVQKVPDASVKGAYMANIQTGVGPDGKPIIEQQYFAPVKQPGVASEMTALRMDQIRESMARAKREDEAKAQTKIDAATERLGAHLQDAGKLNSAISNIEQKLGFSLDDYKDGQPLDLPGANVPGVGRVGFYSGDARQMNAAIAKVFNTELKDRSGAAVTSNELERLKTEFANGKFNTEEEMVAALRDYKNAFRDLTANIEAGYIPEARAAFASRGGFTSAAIPRGKSQPMKIDMNAGGGISVLRPPNAMASAPDAHPLDNAAVSWAKQNPNDSRAKDILKVNGL